MRKGTDQQKQRPLIATETVRRVESFLAVTMH